MRGEAARLLMVGRTRYALPLDPVARTQVRRARGASSTSACSRRQAARRPRRRPRFAPATGRCRSAKLEGAAFYALAPVPRRARAASLPAGRDPRAERSRDLARASPGGRLRGATRRSCSSPRRLADVRRGSTARRRAPCVAPARRSLRALVAVRRADAVRTISPYTTRHRPRGGSRAGGGVPRVHGSRSVLGAARRAAARAAGRALRRRARALQGGRRARRRLAARGAARPRRAPRGSSADGRHERRRRALVARSAGRVTWDAGWRRATSCAGARRRRDRSSSRRRARRARRASCSRRSAAAAPSSASRAGGIPDSCGRRDGPARPIPTTSDETRRRARPRSSPTATLAAAARRRRPRSASAVAGRTPRRVRRRACAELVDRAMVGVVRLVVVTQQVDPASPVLGATVAKLRALAARVDELVVLADSRGRGRPARELPCAPLPLVARRRGRGLRFESALDGELRAGRVRRPCSRTCARSMPCSPRRSRDRSASTSSSGSRTGGASGLLRLGGAALDDGVSRRRADVPAPRRASSSRSATASTSPDLQCVERPRARRRCACSRSDARRRRRGSTTIVQAVAQVPDVDPARPRPVADRRGAARHEIALERLVIELGAARPGRHPRPGPARRVPGL